MKLYTMFLAAIAIGGVVALSLGSGQLHQGNLRRRLDEESPKESDKFRFVWPWEVPGLQDTDSPERLLKEEGSTTTKLNQFVRINNMTPSTASGFVITDGGPNISPALRQAK